MQKQTKKECDQSKITVKATADRFCVDCAKKGEGWLHLRLCLICGQTHCCDSSPNQHATKHFKKTGHELMRSIEDGENWVYCYSSLDMLAMDGMPLLKWTVQDHELNPGF